MSQKCSEPNCKTCWLTHRVPDLFLKALSSYVESYMCQATLLALGIHVFKRTNWEDLPFTWVSQVVYQCSGLLLWEEKCFAHTNVHLSAHSRIPRVGMRQICTFSCTLGYSCVCAHRIILGPMKYIAISAQGSCIWCISCQCFSSLIILFCCGGILFVQPVCVAGSVFSLSEYKSSCASVNSVCGLAGLFPFYSSACLIMPMLASH